MRQVYRLSRGVPRLINVICDRALLGAYALEKRSVSPAIVRRASREARGVVPGRRQLFFAGTVAAIALVVAGAIFLASAHSPFRRRDKAAAAPVASVVGIEKAAAPPVKPDAGVVTPVSGDAGAPLARVDPPPAVVKAGRLAEVLADSSLDRDTASSFTNLFARWGVDAPVRRSDLGCQVGRAHGFECLYLAGNWRKLRRFDLPAILEIVLPGGERRRAALVGLTGDTATLAIGAAEHQVPAVGNRRDVGRLVHPGLEAADRPATALGRGPGRRRDLGPADARQAGEKGAERRPIRSF